MEQKVADQKDFSRQSEHPITENISRTSPGEAGESSVADSLKIEVDLPNNTDLESGEDDQTQRETWVQRLSLKAMISPDYSSVEFSRPKHLGFNYGLLVEYNLSGRLSIATGVTRSKKIYSAKDLEYNGHYADAVDGDCRMWDIPINLYYHVNRAGKSWSFYAGAGLSSYLMSEENYTLYVQRPYGDYSYDRQVKNENNEWFSILNLSAGIQRNIGKHFAVQVEPYLKAPMAGVGEGDVSLASLGAFFNLKYNLSSNAIK
jgi:hypothetical protein